MANVSDKPDIAVRGFGVILGLHYLITDAEVPTADLQIRQVVPYRINQLPNRTVQLIDCGKSIGTERRQNLYTLNAAQCHLFAKNIAEVICRFFLRFTLYELKILAISQIALV